MADEMSNLRGTVSAYQGAVGGIYPNVVDQAAVGGGGGDVVTMDEQLHPVTSIPAVSVGDYTYTSLDVFNVTIATDKSVYNHAVFTLRWDQLVAGDALFSFPAPLGLPFAIGSNGGTQFYGTAFSATAGDAKGLYMVLTPDTPSQQTFTFEAHALDGPAVPGGSTSYVGTVRMAWLS